MFFHRFNLFLVIMMVISFCSNANSAIFSSEYSNKKIKLADFNLRDFNSKEFPDRIARGEYTLSPDQEVKFAEIIWQINRRSPHPLSLTYEREKNMSVELFEKYERAKEKTLSYMPEVKNKPKIKQQLMQYKVAIDGILKCYEYSTYRITDDRNFKVDLKNFSKNVGIIGDLRYKGFLNPGIIVKCIKEKRFTSEREKKLFQEILRFISNMTDEKILMDEMRWGLDYHHEWNYEKAKDLSSFYLQEEKYNYSFDIELVKQQLKRCNETLNNHLEFYKLMKKRLNENN